ncbi:Rhodanese domain protein [Xylariales sp. AK1849]|nr:Rhodanese domain protein [Xylariales sp. AK1849]
MATQRLSLSSILRGSSHAATRTSPRALRCFATASRSPRATLAARQPPRPAAKATAAAATTTRPRRLGVRWSSESATGSKIYSFEEVSGLSADTTLIDVREPSELSSTGKIPGALNIPITTSPDSFHITAEEFEDRFGFERPGPEDEVVFYCKAGVRSRAAAGIAREAGWKNVGEYPGSWVDWSGQGGKVERS